MNMKLIGLVLVSLATAGCAHFGGALWTMRTDQILATAEREIRSKCPELINLEEYTPNSIMYYAHLDSDSDGEVEITYRARRPTRVYEWKSLTNGPSATAADYRCAYVWLGSDGVLRKHNISEWREFPEYAFVRFSMFTLARLGRGQSPDFGMRGDGISHASWFY